MAALRAILLLGPAIVSLAGTPPPASAQGTAAREELSARFALRAGVFIPRARGEVFDLVTESLTLERADFRSPLLRAEVGLHLRSPVELVAGIAVAGVSRDSHARAGHHEDGSAIEQTTRFRTSPSGYLGSRFYLRSRAASARTHTSASRSWNAFGGFGAGVLRHEFLQSGEFLDEERTVPFTAAFRSAGTGFFSSLSAGVTAGVLPRGELVVEARYDRGSAPLSSDFQELGRLDLSGLGVTVGLTGRF